MSKETEVVTYLRADGTLDGLASGGIYADSDLGIEGISDPAYAEHVWAGGVFNTTIIVRQRAPVPTGDLQSTQSQRTSYSQAIEVWVYGLEATAIEAALNRVYQLMMGKRLTSAFRATWAGGGLGIRQAPELPPGIMVDKADYRYVSIRRPVTA